MERSAKMKPPHKAPTAKHSTCCVQSYTLTTFGSDYSVPSKWVKTPDLCTPGRLVQARLIEAGERAASARARLKLLGCREQGDLGMTRQATVGIFLDVEPLDLPIAAKLMFSWGDNLTIELMAPPSPMKQVRVYANDDC